MRKRTIIALILSTMLAVAAFVFFYARPVIINNLNIISLLSYEENLQIAAKAIAHVDISEKQQLTGERLDYFGMSFVFPCGKTEVQHLSKPLESTTFRSVILDYNIEDTLVITGGGENLVDLIKNDETEIGRQFYYICKLTGINLKNEFSFRKQMYSLMISDLFTTDLVKSIRNSTLLYLKIMYMPFTPNQTYWFETQNMRGFLNLLNNHAFVATIYDNFGINHQIILPKASLQDVLDILSTVEFTEYTFNISAEDNNDH
jgi:hypothetical protein